MKQHRANNRLLNFSYLGHRALYFGLIVASIFIMFIGKADLALVNSLSSLISDISTPVLSMFSKQTKLLGNTFQSVKNISVMRLENERLLEENRILKKIKILANSIENENLILRNQLNVIPREIPKFITVRAISAPGSIFAHTLLVQAGRRNGLERGQAVLSDGNFVGQVLYVGELSSRILLISDVNSMIPSVLSDNRIPALLNGNNSQLTSLKFLPKGVSPKNGSLVQTSGHGGVLPPSLPIGFTINNSIEEIMVKPASNLNNIDFVQILLWRAKSVPTPIRLDGKNYKPILEQDNDNLLEGFTSRGRRE